MLVIADGLPPDALTGAVPAWSTSAAPARAHRHILTSTYTGPRPNTLPQVLSLYGFRTGVFGGPDFLSEDPTVFETADHSARTDGCLSDAIQASASWRQRVEGPHFLVLHDRGPPCEPVHTVLSALQGDRVWVIGAGNAGGPGATPVALRAPEELPAAFSSTLDILPTLLTEAGATVPSDARGMDLRAPTDRRAVFFDGRTEAAIRTDRHRLLAVVGPEGLQPRSLWSAAGSPLSIEDPAVSSLLPALEAWHTSLSATSARDRLGQDAFQRILQDGGYWEVNAGEE